jgi:CheY-like chemotaxis protein
MTDSRINEPAGNGGAAKDALTDERARRMQAEAGLREKTEMISTLAHELRTPMGAIISMADLLLTTPLDETQRRYGETLQQSARSLLTLLNDVLDHEKLGSGHFTLSPRPLALAPFFDRVETALSARSAAKGLSSSVTRADDLPPEIEVDPVRLRQVIDNLIDNAVKFTPAGSISIAVGYEATWGPEGVLHIAVSDTGTGIDGMHKAKLFMPYGISGTGARQEGSGTGLGLSITAKLVALMGGTIACDSAPGKGSTFSLALPCSRHASGDAPKIAPAPEGTMPAPQTGADAMVLIVEDNHINQTLIAALLETFGMSFEIATGGEEALDLLATKRFDIVLMDIRMPGMDGLETTRRLRALGGRPAVIPVIALTAQAEPAEREHILEAGLNALVTKPIEPRLLYETMCEAMRAAPGENRSAQG